MEEQIRILEKDQVDGTILIVEDDPMQVALWREIIQGGGMNRIVIAESFDEAVFAVAQERRYNRRLALIISDLFLRGERTGLDLFRVMRDEMEDRFIFVSGLSPWEAKTCLETGVDRAPYLQKPIRPSEAVRLVDLLLHPTDENR